MKTPTGFCLAVIRVITIFFLCIISSASFSQCNDWLLGDDGNSVQYGIATDDAGNVYYGGNFNDSITIAGQNISVVNGYYMFVAKVNNSGGLVWVRYFKTGFPLYIFSPQIQWRNGTVYVGGVFGDTLIDEQSQAVLTYPGFYAAFMLKLSDNDGQIIASKEYGSNNIAFSFLGLFGIAISKSGKIFITGLFRNDFYLDGITLSSLNTRRAFVARLDDDLNVVWAMAPTHTSTTATYFSRGYAIKTDSHDNVVVGGMCWKDITFGSITFNTNNDAGWNPYIAKFDSSGNCQWIKGGQGHESFNNVYALGIDNEDNIYMSAPMDSATSYEGTVYDPSNGRLILNKYDPSGSLTWTKQDGGSIFITQLYTEISPIADHVWVTGWVTTPVPLGAFTIGAGVFAANCDLNGNWKNVVNTSGLISSYESALDVQEDLFIAGDISSDSVSFNNVHVAFGDTSHGAFLLKICALGTPVNEVPTETSLSISPDPASSLITLDGFKSGKGYHLSLFNSYGDLVMRKEVNDSSPSLQIDVSKLVEGVYFLLVKNELRTVSGKFVVQR